MRVLECDSQGQAADLVAADILTALAPHNFGLAWYEQYREGAEIKFREHIFIESTGKLSVSFLVAEKQMSRGGCGPNIAYSLALLGERFVLAYTAVKESEQDTFLQVISSWEREHLLLNV